MSRWERMPRERGNFLTLYDVSTDTVDEAVQRSSGRGSPRSSPPAASTRPTPVASGRDPASHGRYGGRESRYRPEQAGVDVVDEGTASARSAGSSGHARIRSASASNTVSGSSIGRKSQAVASAPRGARRAWCAAPHSARRAHEPAPRVLHDADTVDTEQVRREHESAQHVVGDPGARVADDLRVARREPEHRERLDARVHARDHGEPPAGNGLGSPASLNRGGVGAVGAQDVVEHVHRLLVVCSNRGSGVRRTPPTLRGRRWWERAARARRRSASRARLRSRRARCWRARATR